MNDNFFLIMLNNLSVEEEARLLEYVAGHLAKRIKELQDCKSKEEKVRDFDIEHVIKLANKN